MNSDDPREHLAKIEAELRRLGLVGATIGPAQVVQSPFGMAEMPFEHWLARVFLPRALEAAANNQWPKSSQVGIAAIRNFDGQDEYATLVTLLCEFDQIVEDYGRRARG